MHGESEAGDASQFGCRRSDPVSVERIVQGKGSLRSGIGLSINIVI